MPGEEPPGQLIPWITAEQVMEYLGIKETAYYRWVDKEILQPRGPGEHRYYLSDIRELMERRTYRKRR